MAFHRLDRLLPDFSQLLSGPAQLLAPQLHQQGGLDEGPVPRVQVLGSGEHLELRPGLGWVSSLLHTADGVTGQVTAPQEITGEQTCETGVRR